MHALDQVTRWTGDPTFNRWALELADVAHRAFTHGIPGRRMHWKMSIDLSRPLVPSMGQHDPLDAYVTCLQLEATATRFPDSGGPSLTDAIADFAAMIPSELASTDPLGIGGLLTDGCRLDQLTRRGVADQQELRDRLLAAAQVGLSAYARSGDLERPSEMRLAFRELGLAIGLAAVPMIAGRSADLDRFVPLRREIESFWLGPEHREGPIWQEHENINDVMLATCLAPAGYLTIKQPAPPG